MHEIELLIEEVKASDYPNVIVIIQDDCIRWRPQTESACNLMAEILRPEYNAKAMTKEEFLRILQDVLEEEKEVP